MQDESKGHNLLNMTRLRAAHLVVTHRKPLGSTKATNPKELLMALAPSMGMQRQGPY